MTPGRVRADQHQKIRLVEILVAARHGVGAEAAAMARDGRGHAEPRIRIDIGRADEAFHQLVGDVVILGQYLAGEIEPDRVGAVARDDVLQPVGDMVERIAPGHPLQRALAADHRIKQPAVEAQRFAERRALGAEPAEIGGMIGIAGDRSTTVTVGRRQHAATDAAIGTGGARGTEVRIDRRHGRYPLMLPWTEERARGRTSCRRGYRRSACGCGSARDTRARRRYRRSAARR